MRSLATSLKPRTYVASCSVCKKQFYQHKINQASIITDYNEYTVKQRRLGAVFFDKLCGTTLLLLLHPPKKANYAARCGKFLQIVRRFYVNCAVIVRQMFRYFEFLKYKNINNLVLHRACIPSKRGSRSL